MQKLLPRLSALPHPVVLSTAKGATLSGLVSSADPDVVSRTSSLVTYISTLVRRSVTHARDGIRGNEHLWLDNLRSFQPLSTLDSALLELSYPARTAPPALPVELTGLITTAFSDPAGPEPALTDHTAMGGRHSAVSERAVKVYEDWVSSWRRWAQGEAEAEQKRETYQRIEKLGREAEQLTDSHELVLGIGLLAVRTDGTWTVHRHILTTEVTITADSATDAIRIETSAMPQIRREDKDALSSFPAFDGSRATVQHFDINLEDIHPLSTQTASWLKEWGMNCWKTRLDLELDSWRPPGMTENEMSWLGLAPAVILRPRNRSGLVRFYDEIANRLTGPTAVAPLGLAQLVTAQEPEARLRWLAETSTVGAISSQDPLLPLETNDEQREILRVLQADTAAVVQGPPGTGKTHTIANLICALLADGQRVLITSQKSQALHVLRKKLPESVQDLCVMMSGTQRSGIDELDRSITALSDLQASTNIGQLRRDLTQLRRQREDLQERVRRALSDLQVFREQEHAWHSISGDPYAGSLRNIVGAIQNGRERYGWIGDLPEKASAHPPLSGNEALAALRLLREATPQRAERLGQTFPDDDLLLPVDQMTMAFNAVNDADRLLASDRELAGPLLDLDPPDLARLAGSLDEAADALGGCGLTELVGHWEPHDWRATAVEAQLSRRNPAYWATLFADTAAALRHEHTLMALGDREVEVSAVATSDAAHYRLLGQAKRLRGHLARGGRIRRYLPAQAQLDASELLDSCTVDGVPPTTLPDVETVMIYLQASTTITGVLDDWSNHGVTFNRGHLRQRLAQLKDIQQSAAAVTALLRTRDAIERFLRDRGIRYSIRTTGQWDITVRVVRAGPIIGRARQARRMLDHTARRLQTFTRNSQAAPEITPLRNAVLMRDVERYDRCRSQLLAGRQDQFTEQRCIELTSLLAGGHPELATSLRLTAEEPHWSTRLADIEAAWAWATAVKYYKLVRQMPHENDAERDLAHTEERLSQVTSELAGKQALLHCLTAITEEQRQALQSYRSHVGRHGKGESQHKHRQLLAIHDAMRTARKAVPAWVMPLPVVADTIPPEPDSFDVVIIDEASQASLDYLFLLWLAPRVIVVGDDKQCAPALRNDMNEAAELRDQHLKSLPHHLRECFDPAVNLYELLATRFPKVIRLSEHFRCMPEIIGFSSELFYDRRLIPLRQFDADRLDPLKVVHVRDAITEGQRDTLRNRTEAAAIVDAIQKMTDDPAYREKTIGVIALQRSRQCAEIEKLINERIEPAAQRRHDIRVGQPPDFQGDERDVVLLSMVITRSGRALTNRPEQRRFNVAVTRARDQLWLFTSVTAGDLKTDDLRSILLTYMTYPPATLVMDPQLDSATPDDLRRPFESLLEQRVFLELRRRGYAVIPQYPVGRHRVDLLVVGDSGRLAIECETPDLPVTPEQVQDQVRRQHELRRSGWQFYRVRESEYRNDPEAALKPLWQLLHERRIDPRSLAPAPRPASRWMPPTALSDNEDDES